MWVVIGVLLLRSLLLLIFPDNLGRVAGARPESDRPWVHPADLPKEGRTEGGRVERTREKGEKEKAREGKRR